MKQLTKKLVVLHIWMAAILFMVSWKIGFNVLDKIAATKTKSDRPEQGVLMRMFILAEPKTKK